MRRKYVTPEDEKKSHESWWSSDVSWPEAVRSIGFFIMIAFIAWLVMGSPGVK